MKHIKFLVLLLSGLFAVLLCISLLFPNHIMISRGVKLSANTNEVITTIADLSSWKDWNGLLAGAKDITVKDSVLHWDAANGSHNSVTITGINDKGVTADFVIGSSRLINGGFSVEKRNPAEDSIQIVWFLVEELKWYPWEKFYGMMAADLKTPLMMQSLEKFKSDHGY